MSLSLIRNFNCSNIVPKSYSTFINKHTSKFETVFSFPTIRYIALINRLKVYQMIGTSVAIPSSALMEMFNLMPSNTLVATAYIGLTGTAVFSLATLPFRNIIGHLYISEDNKEIKISSLDFWGRRKDRIVRADDWVPLLDMKPKTMDALYLTPQLTDGTKFVLPVKFGKVLNAHKMNHVLD